MTTDSESPIANGRVVAVNRSATHSFSKANVDRIELIAGVGIADDAHAGETVKHRSRVARNPSEPNHRQVHLIHEELLQELRERGFDVAPGDLGENVTTAGLDLLSLPTGTLLHVGSTVLEVTGLRDPCSQLDKFQRGLMKAVLDRDEQGNLIRKAGVMTVVVEDGSIKPDDEIVVRLPPTPHRPLVVV